MTEKNVLEGRRLVFIGAGNMAEALVGGLISSGACSSERLYVTDVSPDRLAHFQQAFGIAGGLADDNRAAAGRADILVLAVKPQVFDDILASLSGGVRADCMILSIVAGIPTQRIEAGLGGDPRVVRCMPNTPALIGAGMAAVCPGRCATQSDMAAASAVLGAVGDVVEVKEEQMDAVTALSGSGPAYVFALLEAMRAGGEAAGLDRALSGRLAMQTVYGAACLARSSGSDPETLRRRVTSPGGTTEAALGILEKRGFQEALIEAIGAARDRSRKLSE